MQSGLWTTTGPVPVVDVSVQVKIVEFTAQVYVRQKYAHSESGPLAATFKFPLDLFGAVCGFEVVLDGKVIVAQVKKREEATALTTSSEDDFSEDTSYLVNEDKPDVFVCHIGNLEPKKEVELRLTYVTELPSDGEALRFSLPRSTISPNYKFDDFNNDDQDIEIITTPRPAYPLDIKIEIDLPSEIKTIESPTHPILDIKEREGTRARIEMKKMTSLEPTFVLLVTPQEPHLPLGIIEEDGSKNYAVMLSFSPQLSLEQMNACEILFLVDCSNSMGEGSQMTNLKSALEKVLKSLPTGTFFNVIEFGSTSKPFFEKSVSMDDDNLLKVLKYVRDDMDADMGNTELFEPLTEIYNNPPINNLPRQLFIITDGQVPRTRDAIELVRKNSHNTRVFSFGIGDGVSHVLVDSLARAGCGESEYFAGNETYEDKFMRQLKRALQPALTNVHVDWGDLKDVQQAPTKLRTLFNGDRLLVYGLSQSVPEGTVVLKANAPSGPVSFPVDVKNVRTGRLIHVLAARTRIRDLEESEGYDREEIIRLGTTYGLASSETSFVAVELEAKEETTKKSFNLYSSSDLVSSTGELTRSSSSLDFRSSIDSISKSSDTISDRSTNSSSVGMLSPTSNITASLLVPPSPKSGKKVYAPDFLLRFQRICTDLPEGLNAPLDIILGTGSGRRDDRPPKSPKPGRGGSRGGGSGKGHKRQPSKGGSTPSKGKGKYDQGPPVALSQSENRWIRPAGELEEKEVILRKAQGLLNKLTIEKFEPLSTKILQVGITTLELLSGIIALVFDKAVSEPNFSTMYAVLCKKLSIQCPEFNDADGNKQSFRRILLNKCQEEFENKTPPNLDHITEQLAKEELESKYRRRVLGNIKFIGELFKEGMLPEKIMHECINSLIKDTLNVDATVSSIPAGVEEDIECLCKLITTVGKELDNPKSKSKVDDYFSKLQEISENKKFPSRVRFLAKDVMDLRASNWVSRRKDNDPKTIAAARAEALKKEEEVVPTSPSPIKRSESRESIASSQDIRNSRDNVSLRSSRSEEWTPGSSGRGRGRFSDKKPSAVQTSWENKDAGSSSSSGRESRFGGGRGRGGKLVSTPSKEYIQKVKPSEESKKETGAIATTPTATPTKETSGAYKPKLTFSTDEIGTPKSALKSSSGTTVRKEVTIQIAAPKEQLDKKTEMLLEEYWSSGDSAEAAQCVEELNNPDYYPDLVTKAVLLSLEKKDREREDLIVLFRELSDKGLLSADDFSKGFASVVEVLEDIEPDIPFAAKYVANFVGSAMAFDKPLPLSFLEDTLDALPSGKSVNFAASILSTFKSQLNDDGAFVEAYQNANLELIKYLPRESRSEDTLHKLFASKGLNILTPNGSTTEESSTTSTTTTTTSTPSHPLFALQTKEGYWKFNEDFAKGIGSNYEEVAGSMPEVIEELEAFNVWATLLAVKYINDDASTASASDWLSQQAKKDELNLEELYEKADQFFSKKEEQ